jgi:hypothetical protein
MLRSSDAPERSFFPVDAFGTLEDRASVCETGVVYDDGDDAFAVRGGDFGEEDLAGGEGGFASSGSCEDDALWSGVISRRGNERSASLSTLIRRDQTRLVEAKGASTMTRFNDYSPAELRNAGSELLRAANACKESGTRQWTAFVLSFFSDRNRRGNSATQVYPRSRTRLFGVGEFLVDHCHVAERRYDGGESVENQLAWYRDATVSASSQTMRIELALESEWGKSKDEDLSLIMVLDDASKLAALRAKSKVMIFGTKDGSACGRFVEMLSRLRTAWGDSETPWLLVDLPWGYQRGKWNPSAFLLTGEGEATPLAP